MIHKKRCSPAPPEESLLLSPRGGAASLWRWRRRSREEERVERRVKGKKLGDTPVVIGDAAAELVHLFACLLAKSSEPQLIIAGREAEATAGFLEAARGAAEGAPAAAVAIEQRIFFVGVKTSCPSTFSFLYRPGSSLSSF